VNALVDTKGQELSPVEAPSADKLRVYGDMMFLAFRSQRHGGMSVHTLRAYLQPAVELGQFRIFRFDDIPRAMYTWGWLDKKAERKLIEGEVLTPSDWQSGKKLWIIDLIAPYRGMMPSLSRWMMKPGNFAETAFHFRRVAKTNQTRRIVHVDFTAKRLSRVYSEADYLKLIG